jgi:hypothetical protein
LASMFDGGAALRSVFSPSHAPASLLDDSWGDERAAFEADGLATALFAGAEQPFGILGDPLTADFADYVVRGQSPSGGGGGAGSGSGAAAATDPTVPLAQMQFQNLFTPESFDSSGYSNTFVLQPVVPLHISEHGFFPFHILRPTLPIIAPTADPTGPAGVQGGLGDTTVLDVFLHPMKKIKTTIGFGYVAVLPTATHPQLGLGEWKLGPAVVVMTKAVPKWNIGFIYEQPFSLQSNSYQVQMQPVIVRTLPKAWYVGWGDLLWKLDDENGEYDIPINLRVGKVVSVGKHKMNIFVEPYYTPPGLHSGTGGSHRSRRDGDGGGSSWGVKLNVTLLFPEAKLFAPLLSRLNGCGGCYCP